MASKAASGAEPIQAAASPSPEAPPNIAELQPSTSAIQ